MMRQHSLQSALLAALLLAGCGFQLPETDYGTLLAGGVTVQGSENTGEFLPALQAALRSAGADEDGDAWQVEVLNYRDKQSVLRVDARGRVAEYFLESTVDFRIREHDGQAGKVRDLYVSRHMHHNLRGLSDVEPAATFYRHEMRKDLARRLVEQLAEYARTTAAP